MNISLVQVSLYSQLNVFFNRKNKTFPSHVRQIPGHLQITAPSVLWLKENLINIAVQRLSKDVEYIAWLDADIEFDVSFLCTSSQSFSHSNRIPIGLL